MKTVDIFVVFAATFFSLLSVLLSVTGFGLIVPSKFSGVASGISFQKQSSIYNKYCARKNNTYRRHYMFCVRSTANQ